MLSTSYLIVKEITMLSLKSMGCSNMFEPPPPSILRKSEEKNYGGGGGIFLMGGSEGWC